MMKKAGVLALYLTCGLLCFYAAHRLLTNAGEAALHLRLIPVTNQGRSQLKMIFVNTGSKPLKINTGGMKFFVYVSERSKTALLHIWSENTDAGDQGYTAIAPSGSIDAGDAFQLVKNLPAGTKSLTAVYEAVPVAGEPKEAWHGLVRSLPLTVDREK